jgi:hypothetical protein
VHYLEITYCEGGYNFEKVVRTDKAMAMILYKLAFGHSDRRIGWKFA